MLTSKKRKGMIEQAYKGFLKLPVSVVLAGLWLAGAGYISLCVVAFYLFGLL